MIRVETCLLRVLRDHEDKLEVVHSERDVVQLVDVREEDDVLDRVLHDVRVALCSE